MSQENIEIVRRCHERFNDGDIDGFLSLCAPDIEFRDLPDLPGSGVARGHDAIRNWWADLYDALPDACFEAEDVIDAGDHVVVVTHGWAHGKSSGASAEIRFTNVWKLCDGKVISIVSYGDHADALEAAGLRD